MYKKYLTILAIIGALFLQVNASNFRKLHIANASSKVKCLSGSGDTCICPGGCMTKPVNNTTYCSLKVCWKWNSDTTKCEGTGPKFIPAIVLQAIPFTGFVGAGFGNMGRWDLFVIGSAIWGGGLFLICLLLCCITKFDESREVGKMFPSCCGCLLSASIIAYWVWGIVIIANKSVLGVNGCPFADGT